MSKRKILLQLDTDSQPSTFDAVVAADADVDMLLRHGDVNSANVRELIHGCMFTRGPEDLRSTAVFIGGSDVAAGEAVFKSVKKTFFGPLRVSVMLDSNGANTTAAAAVLAVLRHVEAKSSAAAETEDGASALPAVVTVLGATGPVGLRVARLLAGLRYTVRVTSREKKRAARAAELVSHQVGGGTLEPYESGSDPEVAAALSGASVVVACGAIGVQLASEATWTSTGLKLAIDLNAAPPAGLEGISAQDKAADHGGVLCYGALGIGGAKMKIHKACLRRLFAQNDLLLDAEEILAIGRDLGL